MQSVMDSSAEPPTRTAAEDTVDETDLMVLHALQIAPRASWAEIGAAIGMPPTTVARRWARIAERGEAWVTAYVPAPYSRTAMVHVDVDSERAAETVAALCAVPGVVSIDETAGAHRLLLTLVAIDTARLAVDLDRIRTVPGVTASIMTVSTSLVAHGGDWRLDALDRAQAAAMRGAVRTGPRPPVPRIDDLDRALGRALSRDGRATLTDLAQACGASVNTVRRRATRLLESGWLCLRCDLTSAVPGCETTAYLWLRVPPESLVGTAAALAGLPEHRAVMTLAGRHNLLVIAWLHRPDDLPAHEGRMVATCPGIVIDDRTITLRRWKQSGRVIGPDGRASAAVPLGGFD